MQPAKELQLYYKTVTKLKLQKITTLLQNCQKLNLQKENSFITNLSKKLNLQKDYLLSGKNSGNLDKQFGLRNGCSSCRWDICRPDILCRTFPQKSSTFYSSFEQNLPFLVRKCLRSNNFNIFLIVPHLTQFVFMFFS